MNTSVKVQQNFQHAHLELDPNKILFAPNNEGIICYEIWKDIPNYVGFYQASDFGRIKSLDRVTLCRTGKKCFRKGRVIKISLNAVGYLVCSLSKGGKIKKWTVHQLVAMVFLNHNPCGYKKIIDHKDNVKTNNHLSNMQITSPRHNSIKNRSRGSSKYIGVCKVKNTNRWVSFININGKQKYLGYFKNEHDAHIAYQEKLNKTKR